MRRAVVGEEQAAETLAADRERDRQRGAYVEALGDLGVAQWVVAKVLEHHRAQFGQSEFGVGQLLAAETPADQTAGHVPCLRRSPLAGVSDGDVAGVAAEGLAGQPQHVLKDVAGLQVGADGSVDGVQRLAQLRVSPLFADQLLELDFAAFVFVDLPVVGADPGGGRVDAHLEPVAGDHRAMLEDRGHAELHGGAVVFGQRAALELREQLPRRVTEELFEGLLGDLLGRLVGVQVAVLPVEGEEAFVDLLEHGAGAGVTVPDDVAGAGHAEAALQRLRLAARRGAAPHAHLQAAVQAELQRVRQGGDDEQAAAVV